VGVVAKFLDASSFQSFSDALLPKCLDAIKHVLADPEAQSEERLAVTENAFITLGFLSLLHSKDQAQINQFLEVLPLQGDEEAQEAHEFLFEQILLGNAALFSEPIASKVKQALEKIHAARTEDNLNDEGVEKMMKAVEKMKTL